MPTGKPPRRLWMIDPPGPGASLEEWERFRTWLADKGNDPQIRESKSLADSVIAMIQEERTPATATPPKPDIHGGDG